MEKFSENRDDESSVLWVLLPRALDVCLFPPSTPRAQVRSSVDLGSSSAHDKDLQCDAPTRESARAVPGAAGGSVGPGAQVG
ncbi:unnamed protein product [Sphagnum compactum]